MISDGKTNIVEIIPDDMPKWMRDAMDEGQLFRTVIDRAGGKTCEWVRVFDGHFNISCCGSGGATGTGERANGTFKEKHLGARWEFKYCPYCGGEITILKSAG